VVETIVVKAEAVKETEAEVEEGQTGDRGISVGRGEVNRKLETKGRVDACEVRAYA
jgi:hypothetical protein